jgi:hypothetical protein
MSILPEPRTVKDPVDNTTLEQKQKRVGQQLLDMAYQQYVQLCRMQKTGMNFLWNNPNGLTPQQVCDSAGVAGGFLMAAHGALTNCIITAATSAGVKPDIFIPTNAFVVNEDGTVTILDKPYGS